MLGESIPAVCTARRSSDALVKACVAPAGMGTAALPLRNECILGFVVMRSQRSGRGDEESVNGRSCSGRRTGDEWRSLAAIADCRMDPKGEQRPRAAHFNGFESDTVNELRDAMGVAELF